MPRHSKLRSQAAPDLVSVADDSVLDGRMKMGLGVVRRNLLLNKKDGVVGVYKCM